MKSNVLFLLLITLVASCSKNIDYSPEFIEQTSGRYVYNQDELIEVYYKNNQLLLKWKGVENIKPVVLDETTFFVSDMYQKLQFVQHPDTKKRYLSILPEDNSHQITYDYLKVSDTFKTPNMYLKDKEYKQALAGYLEVQKQDSTRVFIEEKEFNKLGYELLGKNDYENAIAVFQINVALYPESDNVYDSLADAYSRNGDSLQAFNNYAKALELNTGNTRAKKYMESYSKSQD